ncbi:dihydropteroate synthase [Candidatus Phycosocius bacilliformis]|uniref:Dihydropteroate synthase n=1 Tax=Candidatus Phycosocius bacilliformis TaxID=1445552 RepID=A0A2P2EC06_9PROT|nr:dihydropteroate synthase [Candidatus Phycosocius bacilliformis]GBF58564.1 dihydropteroate synthase [Candidatus Phycosocius bacilliformis]
MNRFLQALNNRAGPLIMGVINTTPDSFSDGGQFIDPAAAIAHAHALVAAGADLLDLGGESTRPGAEPVGADEEIDRVLPVLQALAKDCPIPISIDTRKPEVARAAIAAGASCWNDVSALGFSPDSLTVAAALDVPVVLMHAQGEPKTMQVQPSYRDVTSEVLNFLVSRLSQAVQAGIKLEHIILDPGIGFGKTLSHNLTLMRDLPRLVALGRPVLVGTSRKRFIEALDPGAAPDNRLGGSLAAALFAARQGAAVLRVHDVAETRQALRVQAALFEERLD